jgi:hypothetical protein
MKPADVPSLNITGVNKQLCIINGMTKFVDLRFSQEKS